MTEDAFQNDPRFVFGSLDQETFGFTLRFDYTVTPNLTVQFYGQPFVSAGNYSEFKRIADPRASAYRDRFDVFADDQILRTGDGVYEVDEDGDDQKDYSFDDPDFNFRDFNSNLVVRWEFQPGSTMFFVWQQARSDFISGQSSFNAGNDMNGLFDVHPHNVFLVKINKWLSL